MLYLTEAEVQRLLPMREAIRLVRGAFTRLARGESLNQPRRRLILPAGAALHYMAASDGPYFGAKIYSTHPLHGGRFVFLLYRTEDAELLALLEANWLGQIRTGAASGLATDLLARSDAATLGLIGTGFQARSQVEAVAAVRPLKAIKVWSRSSERRAAFAAECASVLGVPVLAAETAAEAVGGVDIAITATNSREPVIESAWIAPGCHLNAMGSNHPKRRELPADLVRKTDLLVVDSREQARIEAGDLLGALGEDSWTRAIELADIVSQRTPGREHGEQITVFKSLGLALEDVVTAGFVYEQAIKAGLRGSGPQDYS